MKKSIYVKLAIYVWEKQKLISFLIFFQLTTMFTLAMGCVSIICEKYPQYTGMKNLIEGDGLIVYSYGIEDDQQIPVQSKEKLGELLNGVDVYSCYNIWANVYQNNESLQMEIRGYDTEVIESYTPKMEMGSWLGKEEESDVIHAVVSQNTYGLEVGDTLEIYDKLSDKESVPFQAKIVGVLDNDAKVPGFNITTSNQTDYKNFLQTSNYQYLDAPLLLISREELEKMNQKAGTSYLVSQLCNLSWIHCDDSEQLAFCEEWLLQREVMILGEFGEISRNSKIIFYQEMFQILPIFACVFFMCILTEISVGAITGKNTQYDYGVYRLCGLSKKGCVAVQIVSFIYIMVLSIVTSLAIYLFLLTGNFLKNTVLSFGSPQILSICVIAIVNLIFASIVPAKILTEKNISQILRK